MISGKDSESRAEAPVPNAEAHSAGVSWAAVIGGAFVISALYLILLALGAGFGLSAVSPWSNAATGASAAGTIAIVWLVFIEIVASAFGGYLAGRLRTKWALIHTEEVFFRDTANGFLAWAVALVMSVAFLASAATSMAGSAAQSPAFADTSSVGVVANPAMYYVDALFRSDRGDSGDPAVKNETGRILVNGLKQPQMPSDDQSYLVRLVASKTGLTPAEADKRVANVISQARQAEDQAAKATAHLLLWLFLSLLIGAFSASYAATIGGRQRDHVKAI